MSKAEEIRRGLKERAVDAAVKSGNCEGSSLTDHGDTADYECRLLKKRVITLEDALHVGNVDLKTWRVKDYTINKWEMGWVYDKKQGGEAKVEQLWQVKVRLERIVKKCYSDAAELFIKRFHSLPKIKTAPPMKRGKRMLVPCLFDVHLGKYAWKPETGTDQDTKIQRVVFRNAMADLLELSGGNFDRIMFPLGNDFFQVDNWTNQTAKGTIVDHDGRFSNVFVAGMEETANAIEHLLKIAPVDVVYVPGNHDPATSFYLTCFIEGRFHGNPHVKVDRGPSARKYYRFGTNLIGLTHGNEEKTQDLAALMPNERAMDFAETSTHEWLTGHTHRKRSYVAKDSEEKMGVRMRTIPSLSGTDSWHHNKAYVGCHRAAEAYVYDFEDGYVGHWSVRARG